MAAVQHINSDKVVEFAGRNQLRQQVPRTYLDYADEENIGFRVSDVVVMNDQYLVTKYD